MTWLWCSRRSKMRDERMRERHIEVSEIGIGMARDHSLKDAVTVQVSYLGASSDCSWRRSHATRISSSGSCLRTRYRSKCDNLFSRTVAIVIGVERARGAKETRGLLPYYPLSPAEINRLDILLFSVNETDMTVSVRRALVKRAHGGFTNRQTDRSDQAARFGYRKSEGLHPSYPNGPVRVLELGSRLDRLASFASPPRPTLH